MEVEEEEEKERSSEVKGAALYFGRRTSASFSL
jgi:hypothetical protein